MSQNLKQIENADKKKNKFIAIITYNFRLKLLSFVFAVVCFIGIHNQQVRELSRVAKIKILTSNQHVVVGSQERSLDVTVRIPAALFSPVPEEKDLIAIADLTHENTGHIKVRLSRENFPYLDSRYLITIHDPWLEVDLDELSERNIPIQPVLQGALPPYLYVDKVLIEPSHVKVTGAKSELQKIEYVESLPVNIEQMKNNFYSDIKLVIHDPQTLKIQNTNAKIQIIVSNKKERYAD